MTIRIAAPEELPRVVIVAEHASAKFGGEAALPLHYFRVLNRRGCEVWLVCHARVREELQSTFPDCQGRIAYIRDSWMHRLLWRLGVALPDRISYFTTGFAMRLLTQWAQRRIVRGLVKQHSIEIVHQPMPVSPREPSIMFGVGAPVIIGPMNGGMSYPTAFQSGKVRAVEAIAGTARWISDGLHLMLPGKRRAAMLLVANERTRAALPRTAAHDVRLLTENGADLTLWASDLSSPLPAATGQRPIRFVFMGRLVDWKAVDLLLHAFSKMQLRSSSTLTIIGDGPQAGALRRLAEGLGLSAGDGGEVGCVWFAGWRTQAECAAQLRTHDALVLPSLWECGGAVVLEAMAAGLPVLATAWGGPLDYVTPESGILVEPSSPAAFVQGLSDGLDKLAGDAGLRQRMGAAGRERVLQHFDWERKVDIVVGLYREVCGDAVKG